MLLFKNCTPRFRACGLVLATAIAGFGFAGFAGTPVVAQNIDTIVTASISPSALAQTNPNGSGKFRNALGLLKNKKYADAYSAARGLSDPAERRAIQWAAIYFGKGKIDFESVLRFQADAPHFAAASIYKTPA
ncbi:MAG: hypothetical protein GXP01_03540 [Alphaproteobacteria bacterium]|nr:hypothetical protein [Alphaproteobacteria bacterium]